MGRRTKLSIGKPGCPGTYGVGCSNLPIWNPGDAFLLDSGISGHGVSWPCDDAVLLHLQYAFGAGISSIALRRGHARFERRLIRIHDRVDVRNQHVCDGAGDEGGVGLEYSL